ncbi:MAG TPA: cell division protein SepF [Mycobacteriales bacterium]|nr:cell division protein SepF [Mycobacteriales bacterium]
MPGMLRKSMLYLGLVDDEDYHQPYSDEHPGPTAAQDSPTRRGGRPSRVERHSLHEDNYDDYVEPMPGGRDLRTGSPDVRRVAAPSAARVAEPYRITTLQPRTYNEARTIGEHFREGVPVIINLTEMDDADAKRLVDFAAGLIFGLHGSIERVTNKVFLLSPTNVEVSEADKAAIAEGGFFNQS